MVFRDEKDQHLVRTPYGRGIVLRTRHNDQIKEIELIDWTEDIQDTVLGVCSYLSGGMIISTIDVATHSERADSSTFPLLGNLLQYQVNPYPDGFGTLGNGLDLTINGETPGIDPSTGKYALRYMKSDATPVSYTHLTLPTKA